MTTSPYQYTFNMPNHPGIHRSTGYGMTADPDLARQWLASPHAAGNPQLAHTAQIMAESHPMSPSAWVKWIQIWQTLRPGTVFFTLSPEAKALAQTIDQHPGTFWSLFAKIHTGKYPQSQLQGYRTSTAEAANDHRLTKTAWYQWSLVADAWIHHNPVPTAPSEWTTTEAMTCLRHAKFWSNHPTAFRIPLFAWIIEQPLTPEETNALQRLWNTWNAWKATHAALCQDRERWIAKYRIIHRLDSHRSASTIQDDPQTENLCSVQGVLQIGPQGQTPIVIQKTFKTHADYLHQSTPWYHEMLDRIPYQYPPTPTPSVPNAALSASPSTADDLPTVARPPHSDSSPSLSPSPSPSSTLATLCTEFETFTATTSLQEYFAWFQRLESLLSDADRQQAWWTWFMEGPWEPSVLQRLQWIRQGNQLLTPAS